MMECGNITKILETPGKIVRGGIDIFGRVSFTADLCKF